MDPQARNKLIGALVAGALAIAVYYGLIDQKQADSIRTQADQTLGTGPAPQAPATTQPTSTAPAPPPPGAAPSTAPAAPTPQQPAPHQ